MVLSTIKWLIPLFIISYLWFTMVHPLHGHCRGLATPRGEVLRWHGRNLAGLAHWAALRGGRGGRHFRHRPGACGTAKIRSRWAVLLGPKKKGIEASNIRIFVDPWIDPWISIKHVQTLGFNEWNTFRIWINHPWRIVIQKYGYSI